MRIKILFTLLFVSCFGSLHSQPSIHRLPKLWESLEQDPQLKYGLASLTVLNAASGQTLFARTAHTGMAPASTLKTVTSITAFEVLGQDYRWQTKLSYTGTIKNGVLSGDLIVQGSGDPSLGSSRFEQSKSEALLSRWVSCLKQAGIHTVQGSIIADDSLFGSQSLPSGWVWQDIGNYYGAGYSALNWRENQVSVRFKPGKRPGEAASIESVTPALPAYIRLVNEVSTGAAGTGDNVYAFSAPYTHIIYLRGTYASDLTKTIDIANPDPALQCVYELSGSLKKAGVRVSGAATTARALMAAGHKPELSGRQLDVFSSPALSGIIYCFNQKSINLYGESMLLTMAKHEQYAGAAAEFLKDYWYKKAGIDKRALAIYDGSGLSPENRITAQAMAQILQFAAGKSWYSSFHNSLPVYNGMKLKSGNIKNVLCYAGYHTAKDGTPLIVVAFTNNFNGSVRTLRQKLFGVLDALK